MGGFSIYFLIYLCSPYSEHMKNRSKNRKLSMANNGDKLNIYEVNALLFQIISFMSEAERQKLQAVLTANLPEARHAKDLSSLIVGLSKAKRYKLLERLTNWYHSKNTKSRKRSKHLESRKYPRKSCIIPVELSKNGFTFMCWTQNMSKSGVFIQTDFSFHIDQKVTMILSPPKIERDISVGGRVVRVDSGGIGVKFKELLHDF
jgi:Tfp pilus assembly protein PilZ